MKNKVIVIGGGNVAVDVAQDRSASWRKRMSKWYALNGANEMPAYKEEIEATLAEGIKIRNGWGPKRILGEAQ